MSFKEKIGYFLFALSLFLGYGIPVIFTIIFSQTYDNDWLFRAGISYTISWVLFGLFILIPGKQAYLKIKDFIKNKFQKWEIDKIWV